MLEKPASSNWKTPRPSQSQPSGNFDRYNSLMFSLIHLCVLSHASTFTAMITVVSHDVRFDWRVGRREARSTQIATNGQRKKQTRIPQSHTNKLALIATNGQTNKKTSNNHTRACDVKVQRPVSDPCSNTTRTKATFPTHSRPKQTPFPIPRCAENRTNTSHSRSTQLQSSATSEQVVRSLYRITV